MLTILLDGIAYGMLLFLIASGLAVTLGLMNFVNLAHGAFAMAGGYLAATLSSKMPPGLGHSANRAAISVARSKLPQSTIQ